MRTLVACSAFCLLASCASSKPAPDGRAAGAQERATTYYPLKVGHRWHYREFAMGKSERFWQTSVVEQPATDVFVLEIQQVDNVGNKVGPAARQRLEVKPRGIFDGIRYVLEEPVKKGHAWMAITDIRTAEKFEVVSQGETVRSPAGEIPGCVRVANVIREPGDVQQRTEVVFCEGVGMVETDIRVMKKGRPDIQVSHMQLRAFEDNGNVVFPRQLGG